MTIKQLDQVVSCSRCGRKIVAQLWSETEDFLMVSSEYVGKAGECFQCSRPKKKPDTTQRGFDF